MFRASTPQISPRDGPLSVSCEIEFDATEYTHRPDSLAKYTWSPMLAKFLAVLPMDVATE